MKKHQLSHMDHGFTQAQWDHIFAKYFDKKEFFIDTFELPEGLGTVTDELYGPSAGDAPVPESEVHYARRGEREWKSRLVARPKKPTRFVRVIAGPHEEKCAGCNGTGVAFCEPPSVTITAWCKPCGGTGTIKHACILYTAYGVSKLDMPAAPKEPSDIRKQMAALEEIRREFYRAIQTCHGATPEQEAAEKAAHAQIIALREKRTEADAFWRVHALADEAS